MVKVVKVGKKYVEVGKNGLPLPSKLLKKDVGLQMKDNKGVVKVLKKNASGNLFWTTAKKDSPKRVSPKKRKSPAKRTSPKRRHQLTQDQRMKFRRQISANLDDDDTIRDIFMDVVNALNK